MFDIGIIAVRYTYGINGYSILFPYEIDYFGFSVAIGAIALDEEEYPGVVRHLFEQLFGFIP